VPPSGFGDTSTSGIERLFTGQRQTVGGLRDKARNGPEAEKAKHTSRNRDVQSSRIAIDKQTGSITVVKLDCNLTSPMTPNNSDRFPFQKRRQLLGLLL
jgi:hypothetical protein